MDRLYKPEPMRCGEVFGRPAKVASSILFTRSDGAMYSTIEERIIK